MSNLKLYTLKEASKLHSLKENRPPTMIICFPTVVALCESDETATKLLTFYVKGRLGKVPRAPSIAKISGGSWEDWEKYIGPELLKEWYENSEDWEDDEEETTPQEINHKEIDHSVRTYTCWEDENGVIHGAADFPGDVHITWKPEVKNE